MNARETLLAALGRLPLVAILRGIRPDEAIDVAQALVAAGFGMIEVPLNSPEPFESIRRIAGAVPGEVLVGAGTVLDALDVARVEAANGRLVVAPNFERTVVAEAAARGLVALPGVATPSEAFAALAAGAAGLKLFPAEMIPPAAVKAMLAVLPRGTPLLPVGGIDAGNMRDYLRAGAAGFGIGGSLYRPGDPSGMVGERARALAAACRDASN